jgi:tetratricopeptide (TPR) repeat protein
VAQMRVFVSHSTRDKAFCDTLVAALRGAGADVWYDQESLGAGQLRRVIMAELVARPVFVVVLSKEALASNWEQDECEWAYDLLREDPTRLYLPVLAGALERGDLNVALFLKSMKRVEDDELHPLPTVEAVAQTLRLLALTAAGQPSAPTAPQPSESAADVLARGKAVFAQKRYAEAVDLFRRVTQLAPASFDGWASLARAFNGNKQLQEGLTASERALTSRPDFALGWHA